MSSKYIYRHPQKDQTHTNYIQLSSIVTISSIYLLYLFLG